MISIFKAGFWSEIVSNQTGNQVPDEIVETSVTGMLNLTTVF